ncbi:hypothetical protein AB7B61_07115 [Acinetobacter baumannii]|uniref:hypothetical protein n=1 Tax=Acinetobacter calcoaceticus/baumannii complex TaxID=909768 RepID=UPI00112DAC8E|nr:MULTISPECIES: hypothetical protein [Acinetobacter calcoaceticus/baumannii complex]MDC9817715.1 hypothetical protein [Acinetobacter nosocomialis]MDE9406978.1 hypothetical protein [Acinetobacter nosocomialis]TPU41818.1 hypothetical protein FJU99_05020 [Acinetobacter baumannii]HDG9763861.1 hypothetical protein [Acinetobacter nosocomialis]
MGLMDNQKLKIKQEYTNVWDVVEQLYKLSKNDWYEVAQFLGHHDFDTALQLYHVDAFFKIHTVSFNFEPIRNLIEKLSAMWLEQDDEELKNLKFKLYNYYWNSFDLYVFEPLNSIGLIIDTVTPNNNLQQTTPSVEHLNIEIERLQTLVIDKSREIEQLENMLKELNSECVHADLAFDMKEIENLNLKKEIQDLKSKIQELETQPTIQNDVPDLLSLILDETQTDRYAPDLAYSIKLWLDVYVNNPKTDSHNNKANTWIKNNTPYNGEQDDTPTRRIREIATPFRDLHQSRKRLLENK